MKSSLLAWSCLLFSAASSYAAPAISANNVSEICEAGFAINTTNVASSSRKMACISYLDAVIATAAQIEALANSREKRSLFCLPKSASYDQLAAHFVGFLQKNKGYGNRAGAALVIAAFADKYPCK